MNIRTKCIDLFRLATLFSFISFHSIYLLFVLFTLSHPKVQTNKFHNVVKSHMFDINSQLLNAWLFSSEAIFGLKQTKIKSRGRYLHWLARWGLTNLHILLLRIVCEVQFIKSTNKIDPKEITPSTTNLFLNENDKVLYLYMGISTISPLLQ